MEKTDNIAQGNRLVIGYFGLFLMIIGLIILLPLITIIFYPTDLDYAKCFIIPAVASIFLGYILYAFIRGKETAKLEKTQDSVLLAGVWLIAIIVGSIPFLLYNHTTLINALFEATSGFTTTGITIYDAESLPHIYLIYRSLMLFVGGIGLVLVLSSAISDKFGLNLYSAEGHGDRLVPNLMKSARIIISIYVAYITLGTIAYSIFGMSVFDAINHSIATVSTGGFSTKNAGISYYDNLGVEIITIILMILGGTNFVIHLLLFKGKFGKIWKNTETKFFLLLGGIMIIIMLIFLIDDFGFFKALEVSIFQFVSLSTTCGYDIVDFSAVFPQFVIILMIIVLLIGGDAGSTSGGIKRYRTALAFKSMNWNMSSKCKYERIITVNRMYQRGELQVITDKDIQENYNFIFWYILVFIIGSLIFCACGMEFTEAMFSFACSLTGGGVSQAVDMVSAGTIVKITSMVGMYLGRLEVVLVLTLIVKSITRLRKRI